MSVETIPVVGQREPCPCGSGKRYKNCHGRERDDVVFIARPFESIDGEAELVAILDLLASATCDVAIPANGYLAQPLTVTFATVLPGGSAAYRVSVEHVVVGLQTSLHSSDRSADIAHAIMTAAEVEVGEFLPASVGAPTLRLQDLLPADVRVFASVHDDFSWWTNLGILDADEAEDREFLNDMNSSFSPAQRVSTTVPAFHLSVGDRPQVRMVLSAAEDVATDACARLVAAGEESLGAGSKWLGNFRTCGLLAPVWDVPAEWSTADAEFGVAQFLKNFGIAAAERAPLTPEQRRSRAVVTGKFVTLR